MKLNYKRVLLVGLAFFIIQLFWQTYDTIIPKILNDKFGMSQLLSGIIMSLDNLLALFMLPLFGTISDRTNTKWGRRKPFIIVGTVAACALFMTLTVSDNLQMKHINESVNRRFDVVLSGEDSEERRDVLGILYDENCASVQQAFEPQIPGVKSQIQVTRELFVLSGNIAPDSERVAEFRNILGDAENELKAYINRLQEFYSNLTVEARQDYAWRQTVASPFPMILFVGILFMLLLAMSTFR